MRTLNSSMTFNASSPQEYRAAIDQFLKPTITRERKKELHQVGANFRKMLAEDNEIK